MTRIDRTNAYDQGFIELAKHLDADLAERDGEEHAYYDQFNKLEGIKHVAVLYDKEKPVGCGAIKEFDLTTMEVKRMFTMPESRGKGFANKILSELEKWARELDYEKCLLETGKKQREAIELYKKNGYKSIPNYGQYTHIKNSLCFEKKLILKT